MSKKIDKDSQSSGAVFRYRSPTFRNVETQLLVQLVDKYKNPILNKSTLTAANFEKDKAWVELTKEFNSANTDFERTTEVLKTKWENLKRNIRKCSIGESVGNGSFNDEITRSVIRICESDVGSLAEGNDETPDFKDQKINTSFLDSEGDADDKDDFKTWEDNVDNNYGGVIKKPKYAVATMSPRDCKLLLHCVRQEKTELFSNSTVAKKHKAWNRVAHAFNRRSPTKRPAAELKKKFQTLRLMVDRINAKQRSGNKYEELIDDAIQNIKAEPKSDEAENFVYDSNEADGSHLGAATTMLDVHADPLTNGITQHSELESISSSKNKEIDKLKIELLNYEMETAKLQRKRIEDAMEAEKAERDLRSLENLLRIRAARLQVLAAEAKLPPSHPGLIYTPEESRAQQFMTVYHTT